MKKKLTSVLRCFSASTHHFLFGLDGTASFRASASLSAMPSKPCEMKKEFNCSTAAPQHFFICRSTAFLLLLFSVGVVFADSSTDTITNFAAHVQKFTLKNGMRILVYERPNTPTVSFAMFIRTGAIDDEMGKSGLAHMFEHMFFKGTKTIGTKDSAAEEKIMAKLDVLESELVAVQDRGRVEDASKIKDLKAQIEALETEQATYIVSEEYWSIYERAGAQDLNAATGFDFTNFVVSLPANKMELWMAMESDRIQHPVLREFYKERDVVREERRQRVDNSPDGKLWETFLGTAFLAHPYGRPILGWDSDLSHLTRKDAEAFFKKHYDVSRLVVSVVGGVKAAEVERLMRQYFEGIKSDDSSSQRSAGDLIPVEPEQTGERRSVVEFAAEPSILFGFHRPSVFHPDNAAFEVASSVLGDGRTSRLYKNIVQRRKLATSVWTSSSAPGDRDPNLFVFGATPIAPNTVFDLEKAIGQEIKILKEKGPTPQELEKVRTNLEADVIRGLNSNLGLANQLAYYEAVAGDWTMLLTIIKSIRQVTDIDVQHVVEKYLVPSNRTVTWIEKKEAVK